MNVQAKLILLLGSSIVLILSLLGAYHYGKSTGIELEKAGWLDRETKRANTVATTVLDESKKVLAETKEDQTIQKEANERYETAVVQLRQSQSANRVLVAQLGGLRISANACAGRGSSTPGTEATSTILGNGTLAGTIALPQEVDADLQDAADEADTILERFRSLRDWCIKQGYCGEVKTDVPAPVPVT